MSAPASMGNARDAHVVEEICDCLTSTPAKSFFLFAGAGSGKTRTLVEVLRRLTGVTLHDAGGELARKMWARGQSIRVITYTRNAASVVTGRLDSNELAEVSTIHSFCWNLIRHFDEDIRRVLVKQIQGKIMSLEEKKKGKPPAADNASQLTKHKQRLKKLRTATTFNYSPQNGHQKKGSLTHANVLFATSELLKSRPLLGEVLVARHPILLVDESQDTMKDILNALLQVSKKSGGRFKLGLFGDHRQRIYLEGHKDLPAEIPKSWKRPKLQMNHRSQARIVRLIDDIGKKIDGSTQPPNGAFQHARTEKCGGHVRIFVGNTSMSSDEKVGGEHACARIMANESNHMDWNDPNGGYQILVLEHRLSAIRGGFLNLFNALMRIDPAATKPQGFGENRGPTALRALWENMCDLTSCVHQDGRIDDFAVIDVLNACKQLVDLPKEQHKRTAHLQALQQAVQQTIKASELSGATIREVSAAVVEQEMLDLHPEFVEAFHKKQTTEHGDKIRRGWKELFATQWAEVPRYHRYLQGKANVATHQVVKGSEFDHVMVIMDDKAAAGHLFSYDKVFGAAQLTKADCKNIRANKETSVDRTLRLLYVTSSRARESLALVLWSTDPNKTMDQIHKSGWFEDTEVHRIPSTA